MSNLDERACRAVDIGPMAYRYIPPKQPARTFPSDWNLYGRAELGTLQRRAKEEGGTIKDIYPEVSRDEAESANLSEQCLSQLGRWPVVVWIPKRRRHPKIRGWPFFCVLAKPEECRLDPDPEWIEVRARGHFQAWGATPCKAIAEAVAAAGEEPDNE